MKKLFLLFIVLALISVNVYGQVPQCINYQTIVRNSSGALVKNQSVSLKFDILKNSMSGTMVYSEKYTVSTNQFGIVNVKIGNGTLLSGAFADIDWGNGTSYLKVYLDLNGGTSFTEMGTTQLVSVPYALHAGSIYVHYENGMLTIGDTTIEIGTGGTGGTTGNSVSDYDGNSYDLVTIGTQTFIKSNLKSTHYADGSAITGIYDYANNASNSDIYGKLYSWEAAMHGASSSSASPSGVQGVCPTGFHLPSQDEWKTLLDYVADTYGGNKGEKLQEPGTAHWETATGTNETGFTALGTGHKFGTGDNIDFQGIKEGTSFWSATEYVSNTDKALLLRLYDSGSVLAQPNTTGDKMQNAFPVRCIKD